MPQRWSVVQTQNSTVSQIGSRSLTFPAGLQDGDLAIVVLAVEEGFGESSPASPGGWTELANTDGGGSHNGVFAYKRLLATDSSASTGSWTWSPTQFSQISMIIYRGLLPSGTPTDAVGSAASGTDASQENGNITTTVADDLILALGSNIDVGASHTNAGMTTERLDTSMTSIYDSHQASTGATGAKVTTASSACDWVAILASFQQTTVVPAIERIQYKASINSNSTTVTYALDAAPADGNLLIAFVCSNGSGTWSPQNGWATVETPILNTDRSGFLFKIAGASEPSSNTLINLGTSGGWVATVMELTSATGFDATPFDGIGSNVDNDATKTITASIDPTDGVARYLVGGGSSDGVRTWSGHKFNGSTTGVTELSDQGTGTTAGGISQSMFDLFVSSTASGAYTAEAIAGVSDQGAIHMVVVAPTASSGDVTVSPGKLTLATSQLTATVSAVKTVTASPAMLVAATALLTATVSTSTPVTVSPAKLTLATALLTPTVTAIQTATITPSKLIVATTLPAPTVSTSGAVTVSPAMLTLATTQPTASVTTTAMTSSLQAYWKLDEASGNALDAHGSNTLTDTNTVGAAAGKINGARDFESTNNEVFSTADNAPLSMGDIDCTFQAWVNLESKTADRSILGKWDGEGNLEYLLLYSASSDRFAFAVTGTGSAANLVIVAADNLGSPSTGTWYLVHAWHDATGNVIGISVNAGTADTTATSAGIFNGTSTFYLGGPSVMDGLLDEVGVWKRLLTALDRTALYNSGTGLAYPFDGSSSTNATITPPMLTLATAQPAPTVSAVRTVSLSPSMAILAATILTPTVSGAASVAPAKLTAATVLLTSTVSAVRTVSLTPPMLTLSTSQLAATPSAGATDSPLMVPLALSVLAPTVSAVQTATISPSKLILAASAQTATASAVRTVTVSPPMLTAAATLLAATTSATQTTTISPPVLSLATALPPATTSADATVAPPKLSLATAQLNAAVSAVQAASITPPMLSAALLLPPPTISAGATASPARLTIATSTLAPSIATGTTISPDTLTLSTSTQSVTVSAGGNITLTPAMLTVSTSAPAPAVTAVQVATVSPARLTLSTALLAPTVSTEITATVSPARLTLATSTLTPTVSTAGAVTVAPAMLTLATAIPAATLSAVQTATVSPPMLGAALALPDATVSAGSAGAVNPPMLAVGTELLTPNVSTTETATITPPMLTLTLDVLAAAISGQQHVTATPEQLVLAITALTASTPVADIPGTVTAGTVATASVAAGTAPVGGVVSGAALVGGGMGGTAQTGDVVAGTVPVGDVVAGTAP